MASRPPRLDSRTLRSPLIESYSTGAVALRRPIIRAHRPVAFICRIKLGRDNRAVRRRIGPRIRRDCSIRHRIDGRRIRNFRTRLGVCDFILHYTEAADKLKDFRTQQRSYDFRRVQMRSSPQCSRDAYLSHRRVLELFTIIPETRRIALAFLYQVATVIVHSTLIHTVWDMRLRSHSAASIEVLN